MSEEIPVSTELGSPRGGGGWVKFDEGDGPDSPAARESPAKHGLSSNSSGVSSARGSVNSVRTDPPAALATGAEISVSEIQVPTGFISFFLFFFFCSNYTLHLDMIHLHMYA